MAGEYANSQIQDAGVPQAAISGPEELPSAGQGQVTSDSTSPVASAQGAANINATTEQSKASGIEPAGEATQSVTDQLENAPESTSVEDKVAAVLKNLLGEAEALSGMTGGVDIKVSGVFPKIHSDEQSDEQPKEFKFTYIDITQLDNNKQPMQLSAAEQGAYIEMIQQLGNLILTLDNEVNASQVTNTDDAALGQIAQDSQNSITPAQQTDAATPANTKFEIYPPDPDHSRFRLKLTGITPEQLWKDVQSLEAEVEKTDTFLTDHPEVAREIEKAVTRIIIEAREKDATLAGASPGDFRSPQEQGGQPPASDLADPKVMPTKELKQSVGAGK